MVRKKNGSAGLKHTVDGHAADFVVKGVNNFEFMKVGDSYDCFIKLFRKMTNEDNQKTVQVNPDVILF